MSIRAKLRLTNLDGGKVSFQCEYDPEIVEEDSGFQKATPLGSAEFQIDNPKAVEQLEVGKAYYFDISPA